MTTVEVLLAVLENSRFLGKMFHYFFIFNIMNCAVVLYLLLGIAVLKDLKMILANLLIDLMAFNIPAESVIRDDNVVTMQ